MKRFLLCAALVSFAFASFAADMPAQAQQPKGPAVVKAPPLDWSGAYFGITGGYAWTKAEAGGTSANADGYLVSVLAGYDAVVNRWLAGIEGDIGIVSASGTTFGGIASADINYLATLRGRFGYVFDGFTGYITGGMYAAGSKIAVIGIGDQKTHLGFVAGLGADLAVKGPWRVRAEYLYLFKDSETYTVLGTPVSAKVGGSIFRTGVVYHF